MTASELWAKIRGKVWWTIGIIVFLALCLIVYLSIPKKVPPTPAASINEALVIAQKPLLAQIEDQKRQVADYKNRLTVSEGKYKSLVDKYVDLEKRKQDVKPPETNTEIRSRFTDLGFPPLPAQ